MNYKTMSHNYINTGGHIMVSVFEVWLPDENRTVYVNVGERYCTITTVNHICNDIQIDDFDKITVDTVSYDDNDISSKYFDMLRYCLFEHLKKHCKYMKYKDDLPFEWLLPVYQEQVRDSERAYTENECSGTFATDGYRVWIPTEYGERTITAVNPQHKSLHDTLTACLYRLQATYDCNHEVMDADDLGELLTTIEDVKYYINKDN